MGVITAFVDTDNDGAPELTDIIISSGNKTVDTIILLIISIGMIIGAAIFFYYWKLVPFLESLKGDTAVIRSHTENSHQFAENPNLRDDLDAKHHVVTSQLAVISATLQDVERNQKRVDGELSRVHGELGSLRSDIAVERGRINSIYDRS